MKARNGIWLLLATLALVALGWLSRRPFAPAAASSVVLLTAGWREGVAAGGPVYRLPDAAPQPGAQEIPDVATLRRLVPGLRDLAIHGGGVDAAGAAVLRDVRVTWLDASLASSGPEISAVDFSREIALGQSFRVTGRVVGLAPGGKVTVILDEPDGQPRRVEVVAGVDAAATFALEGHPTAAVGRFRWRLRLGEGGAGADLGAVVKASHQPRVLLTQESATWEFARLHEWLTGAGSEIVLRTRVSADRWRLVGAAGPQLESPALTPALLARFDVLIATEESLRGLSSDERTVLEAVVRSDGLGVLIVGEPTAGTVATPLTPWQLTPAGSDAESIVRTTRLRLVGGRDWPEPMEVWAANWQAHALMRAVVRDPQGGLLVAVEPLGRGRLARSLVAASWRWPLAGHASDYAALWREILGVVARPEAIGGGWRLGPGASVISVGRPIDVTWLGEAGSAPPVARLRFDHETEAMSWRLQSRVDRPGEAWTRWWPARPGWHRLEDEVGHGLELYVSGPGQWPGIERALRQDATRELVRATANVDASQAGAAEARDWLRWRWAAWAAFVISVGALWWRERSAM